MKKILLSAALLFAIIQRSAAQSFETGLSYQHLSYTGNILKTFNPGTGQSPLTYSEKIEGSTGLICIDIGYYYPFYMTADDKFSVGALGFISPCIWVEKSNDTKNFSGQTVASGSGGANYALHIPVFAYCMSDGFKLNDEEIFKDSSKIIRQAMMRLQQFNPKRTGLLKKGLEMSLVNLVK